MRALLLAHWPWAAGYLAAVNLLALGLMGADKRRAKRKGVRRIPERTLFLAALAGGSVGALAGMWGFRHKTRHWYFQFGLPAIFVGQALLVWLFLR